MLQTFRERLTLVLLALLPFHAFLVTVSTKLIAGKGHAPLAVLAVWKEGLLGVILLLMVVELFTSRERVLRISYSVLRTDAIDVLVLFLLLLGAVVTVFAHGDWKLAALGFKYDFLPIVGFFIARRVEWSQRFQHAVVNVLLAVGALVAAYGILTVFLPTAFFQWLGYGPAHSLYFAAGPLAAFQQVSETALRRVQSTMSGPNQLGLWMLIPFALLLSLVRATRESSKEKRSLRLAALAQGRPLPPLVPSAVEGWRAVPSRWLLVVCMFLIVTVLFLSFSRSAWIAAVVMVFVKVSGSVPRHLLKRAMLGGALIVMFLTVIVTLLFPSVFFRLSSSRGHLVRPLQAIGRMISHPLGMGLGSAGPASNRVSETCVFLRPQDDPGWAKTTPTLCVFLGTTQVQPLDHVCRCPFLPENWYLQIGVEMGVVGFILFVALTVFLLLRLARELKNSGTRELASVVFLAFLGISIAALVLHSWEDSAVAVTVWLLAAVALPLVQPKITP